MSRAHLVSVNALHGESCPDFALAFHEAVISEPPFEAVIHTASPHHVRHTAGEERNRGNGASTPAAQAMSDEFSLNWFYWYSGSNQEEFPYG